MYKTLIMDETNDPMVLSTDITKLIKMKLTPTDMRTMRSMNKANATVKNNVTYIMNVNHTDEIKP